MFLYLIRLGSFFKSELILQVGFSKLLVPCNTLVTPCLSEQCLSLSALNPFQSMHELPSNTRKLAVVSRMLAQKIRIVIAQCHSAH